MSEAWIATAARVLAMAPPPPPNGEPTAPFWVHLVPPFLILIVFYFLFLRPHQIRMRNMEQVVRELEVGDQVITSGGIHGTIAKKRDKEADFIMLKIADNVTIKILLTAIQTVRKPDGKTVSTSV